MDISIGYVEDSFCLFIFFSFLWMSLLQRERERERESLIKFEKRRCCHGFRCCCCFFFFFTPISTIFQGQLVAKNPKQVLGCIYMVCHTQRGTFGHLRKVLSRISLRYPRRLIRDDTLRLH